MKINGNGEVIFKLFQLIIAVIAIMCTVAGCSFAFTKAYCDAGDAKIETRVNAIYENQREIKQQINDIHKYLIGDKN